MNTIAINNLISKNFSKHLITKKVDAYNQSTIQVFIGICIAIVLFIIIYIWQINSMAGIGYQMKGLESRVNQLKAKNQELNIQITESKSSQKILSRLEELKMVPVSRVSYIATPSADVAINK